MPASAYQVPRRDPMPEQRPAPMGEGPARARKAAPPPPSGSPAARMARAATPVRRRVALLVCGALALSGCTTTADQRPLLTGQELALTATNTQSFRPWSNDEPAYRIGPGDKLKVKFFITREMDEDVTVSPDGLIGLRSAGQIRAGGMTIMGLQSTIRAASRKELADQKVVVSLEEAASSYIYVGGMVGHPGAFKLTNMRMSALQAVLLAGGFTEEARLGEVAIIRRAPDGRPMLGIINMRDIIETGADEAEVALMAGDILYVPRSNIAEVNLWIDQFINKVVPFQRSFSYTIGSYTTATTGGVIPGL